MVDAGPRDDVVWAGETDAAVDSIDCGDGFDRVVRSTLESGWWDGVPLES